MDEFLDAIKKMLDDASLYMDLLRPEVELRACIELKDAGQAVSMVLGGEVKVLEGCVNPDFKISMSNDVFWDVYQGRADAYALAARGRASEKRPIEVEICSKDREKEVWESIKALLTYFFVPGKIKVRKLLPELAGQAHGAHPIPLVYWDGMRAAWIHVRAGEVLNKEGEKDPWPQVFIILKGKGKAIIHNEEIEIKPNTAIYIPRNTIHQIIPEEDTELIWIAWQTT